jgi:hypothetical protein
MKNSLNLVDAFGMDVRATQYQISRLTINAAVALIKQ